MTTANLFEAEEKQQAEVERLNEVINELKLAGFRLQSELCEFVDAAKVDNNCDDAFGKAQEVIKDWNKVIKDFDLEDWQSQCLDCDCDSKLMI